MFTVSITQDNKDDFRELIPEDVAENLFRQQYRGIALGTDASDTSAALIWEYKHLNDVTKPTVSRLSWLYARDLPSGNKVFTEYGTHLGEIPAQKSVFSLPDEEVSPVRDTLKKAGFSMEEQEGEELAVTVGMLKNLDIVKKTKSPSHIRPLGTLEPRLFRRGLMNCLFHTKRDKIDDLAALPTDWFEPEVSCYAETDSRVTGLLLVHRCSSGRLRVEFMSATGPDGSTDLLYMVRCSILKAASNYPDDTAVVLPRHDESSRKLAGYFFPEGRGEMCIYGERAESE